MILSIFQQILLAGLDRPRLAPLGPPGGRPMLAFGVPGRPQASIVAHAGGKPPSRTSYLPEGPPHFGPEPVEPTAAATAGPTRLLRPTNEDTNTPGHPIPPPRPPRRPGTSPLWFDPLRPRKRASHVCRDEPAPLIPRPFIEPHPRPKRLLPGLGTHPAVELAEEKHLAGHRPPLVQAVFPRRPQDSIRDRSPHASDASSI